MRDPLRIPRILNKLKVVWSHHGYTDMRFGQLLECMTSNDKYDLNWDMEDEQFESLMETWFRRVLNDQQRNRDNAAGRSSHAD
jgi:hypothetical protein